jgi:hypothetical protein
VPRVLTAFRELGPRKFAAAAGLTQSFEAAGDFNYTRAEAEMVKRFDLSPATFLISRLHLGSMIQKAESGAVREDFPIDEEDFDHGQCTSQSP